jgi:hypothetical protein
LALVALGVLVAFRVYPRQISVKEDASFLDTLTASRLVVAAVRVVIFYVAVFIALSVAVRIWNGQWLRKAGPFEVSEEVVQVLKHKIKEWEVSADKDQAEIDRLKAQIVRADETLQVLRTQLLGSQMQGQRVSRRRFPWPGRRTK